MKDRLYSFQVAGHRLDVLLPEMYDIQELLPSFHPFYMPERGKCGNGAPIVSVEVITHPIECAPSAKLLSEEFGAFGHECRFQECNQYYFLTIRYVNKWRAHQMRISRNFDQSQVFIDRNDPEAGRALSFFLMFAYAQRGILFGTFLLHASVVEYSGKGYAFLGKSGTGKSTHSSLWLENMDGTTLLNDDNPAVQFCEQTNQVFISGTPWSGKTHCYKNQIVELGALVRLVQAPLNRFEWQTEFYALLNVLPGCSSLRWNQRHYMCLCNILEKIVKKVPVGILECLPEKSAVELCYEQIKIKTGNEKM